MECCAGVDMVALRTLEVAVFLLWLGWCLCFNHDECTNTKGVRDILLLKNDMFPAANFVQEYSKENFFF